MLKLIRLAAVHIAVLRCKRLAAANFTELQHMSLLVLKRKSLAAARIALVLRPRSGLQHKSFAAARVAQVLQSM